MANRKAVKKVAKKVSRTTRSSSRSSQGFLGKHKNLKWMLPVLLVLFGVLLVVHHYMDESSLTEGTWKYEVKDSVKQQMKSSLHLGGDNGSEAVLTVTPSPTDNSTITPYVTVAPTQGY